MVLRGGGRKSKLSMREAIELENHKEKKKEK